MASVSAGTRRRKPCPGLRRAGPRPGGAVRAGPQPLGRRVGPEHVHAEKQTPEQPRPGRPALCRLPLCRIPLDRRTRTTLDRYSLQLGMVGPSSLARPTQDVVHELIGDRQARGWHYQIHDEPVFNLAWDRTWRVPLVTLPGGLGVDALPTLTLAAGTVRPMRPRAGGCGSARVSSRTSAHRASARPSPIRGAGWRGLRLVSLRRRRRPGGGADIFLDGNTFREQPRGGPPPLRRRLRTGRGGVCEHPASYTQDFRSRNSSAKEGIHLRGDDLSIAFRPGGLVPSRRR